VRERQLGAEAGPLERLERLALVCREMPVWWRNAYAPATMNGNSASCSVVITRK
jgi:hypothetical protein